MTTWPEFEFESEFESASDTKYAKLAPTVQTSAVKLPMFWNPVTGSYQRNCPALSPNQRQPQDGIQVAKRQPLKQSLVRPQNVARVQPQSSQPKKQPPKAAQPLNTGIQSQDIQHPRPGDEGQTPIANGKCPKQPPAAKPPEVVQTCFQPPKQPPAVNGQYNRQSNLSDMGQSKLSAKPQPAARPPHKQPRNEPQKWPPNQPPDGQKWPPKQPPDGQKWPPKQPPDGQKRPPKQPPDGQKRPPKQPPDLPPDPDPESQALNGYW